MPRKSPKCREKLGHFLGSSSFLWSGDSYFSEGIYQSIYNLQELKKHHPFFILKLLWHPSCSNHFCKFRAKKNKSGVRKVREWRKSFYFGTGSLITQEKPALLGPINIWNTFCRKYSLKFHVSSPSQLHKEQLRHKSPSFHPALRTCAEMFRHWSWACAAL